jgi:hypothetical protein
VFLNKWLSTIEPNLTYTNKRLRPDIVNKSTGEVYEIKSGLSRRIEDVAKAASSQLRKYIDALNASGDGQNVATHGAAYQPGFLWTPPPTIRILFLNITVQLAEPGIIVYGNRGELEKVAVAFGLVRRANVAAVARHAQYVVHQGLIVINASLRVAL